MSTQTGYLGLKKPEMVDEVATTIADIGANAEALETLTIKSGTLAARPAANAVPVGAMYLVEDSDPPNALFRSNGVEWQEVGNSGQAMKRSITQVAHGFAKEDIVRLSAGTYIAANSSTPEDAEVVGIVESVKDADNFTVLIGGYLDGLTGPYTAGEVYFLQDAGGLGLTPGTVSKPLFVADSATSGFFFNFRGLAAGTDVGNMPANGVFATFSGALAVAASTLVQVVFSTEAQDDLDSYDPATGQFTAPETGWYSFTAMVNYGNMAVDKRMIVALLVNGAALGAQDVIGYSTASDQQEKYVIGSRDVYLNAGDVVEIHTKHDDSTSRTVEDAVLSVLYHVVGYGSIDDSSVSTDAVWSANKVNEKTRDIGAKVTHNAGQSTTSGADTILSFNTERWDTDGLHDTATNNSRLTCTKSGKYDVGALVEWDSNATGYRLLRIKKNGTDTLSVITQAAISGLVTVMAASVIADLVEGDYVEVEVRQNSGSTLSINATTVSPDFWMQRVA